ncbi:MAG: transposase [Clostridium sp.]|nr:transposase [Clostridium sp.]
MPRTARIKSNSCIYHVMMRSISDVKLFKNYKDKDKFLKILKKYKTSFLFQIYGYCLMDTHIHLIINPNGADISKFMHNINQCYAQYYNKTYNRTGHVFGDRFKSTIATNDISIMCMSAYLHNNPKDISGYKNCVENYEYSSFGIFIGKKLDKYNLVDVSFILSYFHKDPILARKRYYEFVKSRINSETTEIDINHALIIPKLSFSKDIYNKPVIRNAKPEQIINYLIENAGYKNSDIYSKFKRNASEFRSICAFLMRIFCNYNYRQIQSIFSNISLSSISILCNKGYLIIQHNPKYANIVSDFMDYHYDMII